MSTKKFEELKKIGEDSEFSKTLLEIELLRKSWDEFVTNHNKLLKVHRQIMNNQFDRYIIDFRNSMPYTELSEGDWKGIMTLGLNQAILNCEKGLESVSNKLNQLINVAKPKPE